MLKTNKEIRESIITYTIFENTNLLENLSKIKQFKMIPIVESQRLHAIKSIYYCTANILSLRSYVEVANHLYWNPRRNKKLQNYIELFAASYCNKSGNKFE